MKKYTIMIDEREYVITKNECGWLFGKMVGSKFIQPVWGDYQKTKKEAMRLLNIYASEDAMSEEELKEKRKKDAENIFKKEAYYRIADDCDSGEYEDQEIIDDIKYLAKCYTSFIEDVYEFAEEHSDLNGVNKMIELFNIIK